MTAKETVLGTAKRLVAEIVGDGRLAEEGTYQAGGTSAAGTLPVQEPVVSASVTHQQPVAVPGGFDRHVMLSDEERFAALLGHAAIKIWSDLPREVQERLFTASVDDGIIANSLAVFLHDRHPRTAHPPKPTQFA